jgi:hypothetical protein
MKSVNDIKHVVKNLKIHASSRLDQRVYDDLSRLSNVSENQRPADRRSIKWRNIMKAKLFRYVAAAAAVMLVLGLVEFWPSASVSNRIYGMENVFRNFQIFETLHIWGTKQSFYPLDGFENQSDIPTNIWLDKRAGRARYINFRSFLANNEGNAHANLIESIVNDSFVLEINHSEKTVQFFRISEFNRWAHIRSLEKGNLELFDEDQALDYIKMGTERVAGEKVNVWEKLTVTPHPYGGIDREDKNILWVSPETLRIIKVQNWLKRYEHLNKDSIVEGEWKLIDNYQIETDVMIPERTFDSTIPVGYKIINELENAPLNNTTIDSIGIGENKIFRIVQNIALPDGTIIMGWWIEQVGQNTSANKIETLEPGRSLPTFPVEIIYGLSSMQPTSEMNYVDMNIEYTPRHLAFTQKEGKVYEWSLYVPNVNGISKREMKNCQIIAGSWGKETWVNKYHERFNLYDSISLFIKENEFDIWVRGAMAELSDDRKAPDYVTYDFVMNLARELGLTNLNL